MSDVLHALDGEHVELLARLALFREKVLERKSTHELTLLLDAIHDALVLHFREEEGTMKLYRYGGMWPHHDEHFVIWHAFLRLRDICHKRNFTPRCGELVFNAMSGMLQRHIENFDRQFIAYITKRVKK